MSPPAPSNSPDVKSHAASRGAGRRARPGIAQVLGELLLTAGVLILLFAFYEAFWTNITSGRLQAEADTRLEEMWDSPGGRASAPDAAPPHRIIPARGEAFARLHIPALESDNRFAVVEGTGNEELIAGPGHYTDSQLPGEPGNFAVAGHRAGKGAPFRHLDQLETCDALIVETQTDWLIYRVMPMSADGPARRAEAAECLVPEQVERVATGDYAHVQGHHITLPNAVEVINPLPGTPVTETAPGLERITTLTTCHPWYSNTERMIIHAIQVDSIPKDAGDPTPALEES